MFTIATLGGLGRANAARGGGGGGGPPAPNTNYGWDPSVTENGSPTYSNTDHLITFASGVIGAAASFGTRSKTALSGKVYCEFELVSQDNNNNYHGFGIVESAVTSGFGPYVGSAWNILSRSPTGSGGCGLPAHGVNTDGSVSSASGYAHAAGTRIGIAVDASAGKIWYRIGSSSWVSGDPAAGTGETQTFATGTHYFAYLNYSCSASGVGTSARICPKASDFAYSAPSGFSAYDGT